MKANKKDDDQYPESNNGEKETNLSMVEESAEAETKYEIDEESMKICEQRFEDWKDGKIETFSLNEFSQRFEQYKTRRNAL